MSTRQIGEIISAGVTREEVDWRDTISEGWSRSRDEECSTLDSAIIMVLNYMCQDSSGTVMYLSHLVSLVMFIISNLPFH